MISRYFTNKSLCLDPRFWGRISGYVFVAKEKCTKKYFLVATIYGDFVGGLVETLYMLLYYGTTTDICPYM